MDGGFFFERVGEIISFVFCNDVLSALSSSGNMPPDPGRVRRVS
jgi:hypothetical protein